jgi:BlaI family penicillinase repressor
MAGTGRAKARPTSGNNPSAGLLGPLESAVMRHLWSRHSSTAIETTQALNRKRDAPLSPKTVLTSLTRLEQKGLVEHSKDGRSYRFHAAMSEQETANRYVSGEMESIIDQYGEVAIEAFVDAVRRDPRRMKALRSFITARSLTA